MKRRELVRKLEAMGCVLVRHGARHDWYTNPKTKNRGTPTSIAPCGRRPRNGTASSRKRRGLFRQANVGVGPSEDEGHSTERT